MRVNSKKASIPIIAAAVVAVITMSGGPANAAQSDTRDDKQDVAAGVAFAETVWHKLEASPDPGSTFTSLPDAEREAIENYLVPATYEETVTLVPTSPAGTISPEGGAVARTYSSVAEAEQAVAAAAACYGAYVRQTAHAPAGNAIWDIYTEGSWCGTAGSSATSATFGRSWSSIAALGWRDAGQKAKGAGLSGGTARIWAQRTMILGTGGWDIQTMYPCTRLLGTGGGGYWSDKVCSVY